MGTRQLGSTQRKKLRDDIKKWCDDHGMFMKELSSKMGFSSSYVANVIASSHMASFKFWHRLKETTGLEEENYK